VILPEDQIRYQIESGQAVVRPLSEDAYQPASLDLRLGRVLKVAEYRGHRVHDLMDDGPFYLSQFVFALGATLEWVEVPTHLAAILAGKSSLARQGMVLESAGYVDPGWRGELTLEMFNLSPRPVRLEHGMKIGQIRFEFLFSRCERPYGSAGLNSHYQDSTGPVESRAVVGRPS